MDWALLKDELFRKEELSAIVKRNEKTAAYKMKAFKKWIKKYPRKFFKNNFKVKEQLNYYPFTIFKKDDK